MVWSAGGNLDGVLRTKSSGFREERQNAKPNVISNPTPTRVFSTLRSFPEWGYSTCGETRGNRTPRWLQASHERTRLARHAMWTSEAEWLLCAGISLGLSSGTPLERAEVVHGGGVKCKGSTG